MGSSFRYRGGLLRCWKLCTEMKWCIMCCKLQGPPSTLKNERNHNKKYPSVFWDFWGVGHPCDCTSWQIPIIKSTRCADFLRFILGMKLHVSDSSSVHHQEFFTVHTVMVYVTLIFIIYLFYNWASRIRMILLASCLQICMTYTIAVCTVKNSWWWKRNCPKHADFHSKNKFENLVHLVWFYYRNFWGG